ARRRPQPLGRRLERQLDRPPRGQVHHRDVHVHPRRVAVRVHGRVHGRHRVRQRAIAGPHAATRRAAGEREHDRARQQQQTPALHRGSPYSGRRPHHRPVRAPPQGRTENCGCGWGSPLHPTHPPGRPPRSPRRPGGGTAGKLRAGAVAVRLRRGPAILPRPRPGGWAGEGWRPRPGPGRGSGAGKARPFGRRRRFHPRGTTLTTLSCHGNARHAHGDAAMPNADRIRSATPRAATPHTPALALALLLSLAAGLGPQARSASAQPARAADSAQALAAFRSNIAAIHARDRARYLEHYLRSPRLVRAGPAGLQYGYAPMAEQRDDTWPDTLAASHFRVTPLADGVVYGAYHYRVTQG